jgi:NitT/TauT family transport system ATP-binding protein
VIATQPGSIKQVTDVALRHPRERSDRELVELERRIKELVREEVIKMGVV